MTKIDVIRNGRFSNPRAEQLRKEIISMDCGYTKGMIDALNNEIYNERDENNLIESLINTKQEMESEIR